MIKLKKCFTINESRKKGLNRRGFITKAVFAGATLTTGSMAWSRSNTNTKLTAPGAEGIRKLGSLDVSPIGLGCMSMKSGSYNPPRDAEDMIPVIRGAIDLGVTFFDTAEVYGPFTDE